MTGFGISVSKAIIAVHGGFSGPGPSLFNPPTASNLWIIGRSIHPGTMLNSLLTALQAFFSKERDGRILLDINSSIY